MAEGKVYIYGGKGHGKSPAAIGCGLIAAAKGARVVIIQFLKGKGLTEDEYPRRLEPGIKLFRFEKSNEDFVALPREKQEWPEFCQKGPQYGGMRYADPG